MIDSFVDTLEFFPRGLIYVGLGIVILIIAKYVQDFLTPYKINAQLTQKDNVALGLSIAGYYLGVIAVFLGVIYSPITAKGTEEIWKITGDFGIDLLWALLYSLGGIAVLNLARIVVDKLVLYRFDTEEEIVEKHNTGVGVVEFAVYVSVGMTIAASTASSGGVQVGLVAATPLEDLFRTLAFFGLGMALLILFTLFYQKTTSFDIHEELSNNNTAVGVALAGNLIAISVVIFKAVFGEFSGWVESLVAFITFAILGFVLLYVIRTLVDLVLLPGTKISHELATDRNLGVAFIEGGVVVSTALILYFAI